MVSRHGMYEDARHRAQALDRKHEKGLAVMADGTSGTAVYEDTLRREEHGWRISRRKVVARAAS